MAVTWEVVSYDGNKTVDSLSDVLTTLPRFQFPFPMSIIF